MPVSGGGSIRYFSKRKELIVVRQGAAVAPVIIRKIVQRKRDYKTNTLVKVIIFVTIIINIEL